MLLIDAGNSQIKLCRWDGNSLGQRQYLNDDASALAPYQGQHAIISCVATPAVREQLQRALHQHAITAEWLQSPTQGLGLSLAYPQPEKLGVDRWLALAAAYASCGHSCCVIDAGTAITVDLCDQQGKHLGGLIAPGLHALNTALRQDTALPWLEDNPAQTATLQGWASDTQSALQLGSLYSACGLIDYCHNKARREHHCQSVFLTGGGAQMLQAHLQGDYQLDKALVFKGLALYAQQQRTNAADSL